MKKFLIIMPFLLVIHPAVAKDWLVDTAHSTIRFVGEQSGEKFTGGFRNFTPQITLDPDHPDDAKIIVTIDISSAFAGSDDRDQLLLQADWFNSSSFPQARFVSTAVRKTGPGLYEAGGDLTIKGITRAVILPFTLRPEGDHWRAQGTVKLMRNDFNLGQGTFKSEDYVKFPVDVTIDIQAK